jgi:hypothetical protein
MIGARARTCDLERSTVGHDGCRRDGTPATRQLSCCPPPRACGPPLPCHMRHGGISMRSSTRRSYLTLSYSIMHSLYGIQYMYRVASILSESRKSGGERR